MTPKEQAIILYNKFMEIPYPTHSDRAKHCALISVNEIISNRNKIHLPDKLYWQRVKKEIEKL